MDPRYEQIRTGLNALCELAHENAVAKGFYEGVGEPDATTLLARCMLIVTEAAEAAECVRNNEPPLYYEGDSKKPLGLASEVADIVIRCGDNSKWSGIRLGDVVVEKMLYNASRPFKHGGKAL